MELILIDDDRLKIMLSREDMEHYHISGDELDYSMLSTRTILKTILNDAKKLTGFDTEGERFFVQLFTSAHGGCELFITKGERENFNTESDHSPRSAPENITQKYQCVYSFESVCNLISACRRLRTLHTDTSAIAYSDIVGKYFLLISHTNLSPYVRLDKFTFMLEYGKRENTEYFERYIQEYGNWTCNNAIETLSKL